MASDHQVLLCTCDSESAAAALAHQLVNQNLAACVNIVPRIRSIYKWQNKVEDDAEVLLIIKTQQARVAELKDYVAQHHSYDSPELIAIDIVDGLPDYLAWIEEQTR